ncbi:NAD-dependent epimerase/dehydratase family protein [Streptomyces hilarionis]|uniref:NAD-dependent epimerase/dehydratase family protein n=1 Tax=Streptomyces hilarionis TaxID=2839954 RepID=UPI00211A61B2|nr:NAD-dependent epimerase/dehydratase family protein [Streptomyces hilarionis]MCQ9135646.1 NAD-dependent epimerase/dehydratase family protein [Streptomyces hilarionis]
MSKHLIVGAGPIGSAAARLLAARGEEVVVVSRSGAARAAAGPADGLPGIRHLRLDATDAAALGELATGAAVLYNCANPAYHRWATAWPPLAAALLAAAERSGAVLATVGNLYGYGAVTAPMTEDTPLAPNSVKGRVRARMWEDALALHRAGRIRTTEIRSSDYIGPHAESPLGARVVPRLLAGRGVQVLRSADTAHSWTYTEDAARLLVAVGSEERAWGRPWHVPTNPPRTQREAVADLAEAAGVAPVRVGEVPGLMLTALGVLNPTVRALREVAYQFERPFVMDSEAAVAAFGIEPTPWTEVLNATVDSYRTPAAHR